MNWQQIKINGLVTAQRINYVNDMMRTAHTEAEARRAANEEMWPPRWVQEAWAAREPEVFDVYDSLEWD